MSPNPVNYNRKCSPAAADGLGHHPRPPYQYRKNPIGVNTVWEKSNSLTETEFLSQTELEDSNGTPGFKLNARIEIDFKVSN